MTGIVLVFFVVGLIALVAGNGFAGGSPQEEANKNGVAEFYEKVLRIVFMSAKDFTWR